MREFERNVLPVSVHGKSALYIARHAALESGKVLKSRFNLQNEVKVKGRRDLVTEADLMSERSILGILSVEFPSHGILSEESGETRSKDDYSWIIDPLDGTNNYHFGIPFFCVNIALACRGRVVLGFTHDPLRGESFYAVEGGGARLNGRKIVVSATAAMAGAAVGIDLGYVPERSAEMLDIVKRLWPEIHCLRLTGSSSLGLAYVAAGRLSMYFHRHLFPWDTAAGLLLVREAGGEVTDFDGNPAACEDKQVIAANPGLNAVFREWLSRP